MEDLEKHITTVDGIREKAKRSRITAFIALILAVISLVGGSLAFYSASDLVASDFNVFSESVISIRNDLESRRERLESKIHEQELRLREETFGGRESGIRGYGPISESIRRNTGVLQSELEELDKQIGTIDQRLSNLANNRADSLNFLLTPDLISIGLVRLLIIGALIYLVRLFVNLYKYNIRLADHHDSIADAIEVSVLNLVQGNFLDIAGAITPRSIDFDSSGNSLQDALAFLKFWKQ